MNQDYDIQNLLEQKSETNIAYVQKVYKIFKMIFLLDYFKPAQIDIEQK